MSIWFDKILESSILSNFQAVANPKVADSAEDCPDTGSDPFSKTGSGSDPQEKSNPEPEEYFVNRYNRPEAEAEMV